MISLLVLLVQVVIISISGILNKKLRGKIEVVGANAVLKLHDERRCWQLPRNALHHDAALSHLRAVRG